MANIFYCHLFKANLSTFDFFSKLDDCSRVFLFSNGQIGEYQSAILGKYNLKGTHNGRPYFTKIYNKEEYYLFYQSNGKYFSIKMF